MLKNKDLITSHLKKKAQSKLTLSISAFAVIITSTGYLFNSKETKRDNPKRFETDTLDYDGSGNFGRIPNKKPKNRAN